MKSYLPGFPVNAGCLPVVQGLSRPDLSLGAVCREIGLVGWFYTTIKLPPLLTKSLHFQLPLLPPISASLRGFSCLVIGLGFWLHSWQHLLQSPFSLPFLLTLPPSFSPLHHATDFPTSAGQSTPLFTLLCPSAHLFQWPSLSPLAPQSPHNGGKSLSISCSCTTSA